MTLRPFAVSRTEVTNAEYARFVTASKYRPARPERFLADWVDGKPRPGTESEPVRHVSLDDARSFAERIGRDLQTLSTIEGRALSASAGYCAPACGPGSPIARGRSPTGGPTWR